MKNSTLKEVIDRCEFKNVAPIIAAHYPETAGNRFFLFKEEFDILRRLSPDSTTLEGKTIEISCCYYDEEERKDRKQDYYIQVSGGQDVWEHELVKEIIVLDDLTLTAEEIVAHCLWEMTFFGGYADRDERKKYIPCDLNYKQMYCDKYCSYAFDVNQRVDYMIDLFINYQPDDFAALTDFWLMFRTAPAYPLSQEEWNRLQSYFKQRLPNDSNICYGQGIDDHLGSEVSLVFMGCA